MSAQILKFPRQMPKLLELADNLHIQLLSYTPMAQAQADRLIAEFEACKRTIQEGGNL